jgi:hypothetical protein
MTDPFEKNDPPMRPSKCEYESSHDGLPCAECGRMGPHIEAIKNIWEDIALGAKDVIIEQSEKTKNRYWVPERYAMAIRTCYDRSSPRQIQTCEDVVLSNL